MTNLDTEAMRHKSGPLGTAIPCERAVSHSERNQPNSMRQQQPISPETKDRSIS